MAERTRLRKLRSLGAVDAFIALRAYPIEEQVATWLELFHRTLDPQRLGTANGRAMRAVEALAGVPPEKWLETRGFTVVESRAPSTFGTATVRAWCDEARAEVVLFQAPMASLCRILAPCGLLPPVIRSCIVAHEAFHVADPRCPTPIAELAAHLFAGTVSSLGCFGGALDVLSALGS